MLKKILSISGRPGLYQLVSYGKNMLVVEGLARRVGAIYGFLVGDVAVQPKDVLEYWQEI